MDGQKGRGDVLVHVPELAAEETRLCCILIYRRKRAGNDLMAKIRRITRRGQDAFLFPSLRRLGTWEGD